MSLLKRLRNLWKLSDSPRFMTQGEKNNETMLDLVQKNSFTVSPMNTSYRYEGTPKAQIIKRKPADPLEEAIKQDE